MSSNSYGTYGQLLFHNHLHYVTPSQFASYANINEEKKEKKEIRSNAKHKHKHTYL